MTASTPGPGAETTNASIERSLAQIDAGIRQLKVQYDQFFAGALPKEPHELKTQVQRQIKTLAAASIRKYAYRFHFNSLVSRFNSLSELWTKTVRAREEGRRPGAPKQPDAEAGVIRRLVLRNPQAEQEVLRDLHARFLKARQELGTKGRKVTFESFLRSVRKQADRLRKQSGCSEVELRLVVKDRKVQLKARAGS